VKRYLLGCWLLAPMLMGCATTKYEEFGEPPTGEMARQSAVDSVPLLQVQVQELEKRVARLEAELVGRFSGLEASQGDLATRVMSLAEQLEAVSRQLQMRNKPAAKATPQRQPVQDLSRLYERALSAYYDRQYVTSQDLFEQVLNSAPGGEWADNAQYWIGECEYGKKNYEAALDAFHKVFQYEKTEKDDDAQFMLGQCYFNMGSHDNALVEFNRLKIDYPKSEYLGRAEAHIRKIRDAQTGGP
jgi:TolA-binding protein